MWSRPDSPARYRARYVRPPRLDRLAVIVCLGTWSLREEPDGSGVSG